MKKYHGIELKEVTKQQVFDPPKEMLVWDDEPSGIYKKVVCAIASKRLEYPVLTIGGTYRHCAEIPKSELNSVTYLELSQWLAKGNGRWRKAACMKMTYTNLSYDESVENEPVDDSSLVRKWKDTEWHKPTREYLGLEDK